MALGASGRLAGYRATFGTVAGDGDAVTLDAGAARVLGVGVGDQVTVVGR